MYYFIYGLLYLLSLIPFFIIYRISDFVYFLLYHVFGYRKKVVMQNLDIAFPEKSLAEKEIIARQFYKNLVDTFIETIKMLSMTPAQLGKRALMDTTELNQLAAEGRNIQLHSGHQMNWEYANWGLSSRLNMPLVGVYTRIGNAAMDRIFRNLRSKPGTVLVSTEDFRSKAHNVFKQQYAIGLIADQNPARPHMAYWLNFFNKPVSFPTGPESGARKNNPAIVFVKFVRLRRGYYRYEATVVSKEGANFKEGELTRMYRDFLEDTIRKDPANYLWTHRRWRRPYLPEYEGRWIDNMPPFHNT
jgi:KDO2-lipid IV(A) lauroyltransferase